jgi:hypothetical protein
MLVRRHAEAMRGRALGLANVRVRTTAQVQLLRDAPTCEAAEQAARALANLCDSNDANLRVVQSAGGVQALVGVLKAGGSAAVAEQVRSLHTPPAPGAPQNPWGQCVVPLSSCRPRFKVR